MGKLRNGGNMPSSSSYARGFVEYGAVVPNDLPEYRSTQAAIKDKKA